MLELLLLVDDLKYPDVPVREAAVVALADAEPAGPPDYPAPEPEPEPLAVPPILEAIAECESGGAWHGQDGDLRGTAPRSSASGRWRFIDSTWSYVWADYIGEPAPTARAKHATPGDQTRAAVALYEREGLAPWYASKGCWG